MTVARSDKGGVAGYDPQSRRQVGVRTRLDPSTERRAQPDRTSRPHASAPWASPPWSAGSRVCRCPSATTHCALRQRVRQPMPSAPRPAPDAIVRDQGPGRTRRAPIAQ